MKGEPGSTEGVRGAWLHKSGKLTESNMGSNPIPDSRRFDLWL